MATFTLVAKPLSFVAVSTLKHIAIAKVIFELWKLPDSAELLESHCSALYEIIDEGENLNHLDIDEKFVQDKLRLLNLPEQILQDAVDAVRPIGLQILMWMNNVDQPVECRRLISNIHWAADGTIDECATLKYTFPEQAVLDQELILRVFRSACRSCNTDYLFSLWQKMPESVRQTFFECSTYNDYEDHIMAYWACYFENKLDILMSLVRPEGLDDDDIYNRRAESCSLYENMTTLAVTESIFPAVKYFWSKLTQEEKCINLVFLMRMAFEFQGWDRLYLVPHGMTRILCFLISRVNYALQQKFLFVHGPEIIDILFLDWTLQKFLLPTLSLMWVFLDGEAYVQFLATIIEEMTENRNAEKILFREVWTASPPHLKINLIRYEETEERFVSLFCRLFAKEDMKTIMTMLNDFNCSDRRKIFIGVSKFDVISNMIRKGKMSIIDAFMKTAISTEHDMILFKNDILTKTTGFWRDCIFNHEWEKLEEFLRWFSEKEIVSFKKGFVGEKLEIAQFLIQKDDMVDFDKFLSLCFDENDVAGFKKLVLGMFKPTRTC